MNHSNNIYKHLLFLLSVSLSLLAIYATQSIKNIVHADTPSTNLISGSSDFSGEYWHPFNNEPKNTGLSIRLETDSDGDKAEHITGTATTTGIYGLYNTQYYNQHPKNTVFSAYVKGSIGTGSIYNIFTEQENTLASNVGNGVTSIKADRYKRFWSAQQTNATNNTTGINSDVVYFNVKAGTVLDLWVKNMKLESGTSLGFDQTTIASGLMEHHHGR